MDIVDSPCESRSSQLGLKARMCVLRWRWCSCCSYGHVIAKVSRVGCFSMFPQELVWFYHLLLQHPPCDLSPSIHKETQKKGFDFKAQGHA
jgi:hypothetical protein